MPRPGKNHFPDTGKRAARRPELGRVESLSHSKVGIQVALIRRCRKKVLHMAQIDSRTSPAFHYLPFLSYYEAPPGGNYGTQFAHWGGGHQVLSRFQRGVTDRRLSGSNRHPSAATWIEARNRHAGSAAVTSPTSRFLGRLK